MIINYFIKWVEAASYASVTRSMVCKFIKKEIIYRYGLFKRIISNNASNLNNKMMDEVCAQFKIQHHNSMPYRPKMNGAIEATNKNLKKIIDKTTDTYKDWHEKLPWLEVTLFSLVYGIEVVLPIEVEIPSLGVLMETKLDGVE